MYECYSRCPAFRHNTIYVFNPSAGCNFASHHDVHHGSRLNDDCRDARGLEKTARKFLACCRAARASSSSSCTKEPSAQLFSMTRCYRLLIRKLLNGVNVETSCGANFCLLPQSAALSSALCQKKEIIPDFCLQYVSRVDAEGSHASPL